MIRALARHLFKQKEIEPIQLYGLSKLTWITESFKGDAAKYICSTKIPALIDLTGINNKTNDIEQLSLAISEHLKDQSLRALVNKHTGFTNLYKAYRNSVLSWITENIKILIPLYKSAYFAKNESERIAIIKTIEKLPKIEKAGLSHVAMQPEFFLTPVFFALDKKIKFPIINGRANVQNLLRSLGVSKSPLSQQYRMLTGLYGKNGISDAADLDQIKDNLDDFIDSCIHKPLHSLIKRKSSNKEKSLSLKDESDVDAIWSSKKTRQKRIHNKLTNKLLEKLSEKFNLSEGNLLPCKFDVFIRKYDGKNDLLIEAKSSADIPHIRMAIGQLFSYRFTLFTNKKPRKRAAAHIEDTHLSILLDQQPDNNIISLLDHLGIKILWFEGNELLTTNQSLACIATISKPIR